MQARTEAALAESGTNQRDSHSCDTLGAHVFCDFASKGDEHLDAHADFAGQEKAAKEL